MERGDRGGKRGKQGKQGTGRRGNGRRTAAVSVVRARTEHLVVDLQQRLEVLDRADFQVERGVFVAHDAGARVHLAARTTRTRKGTRRGVQCGMGDDGGG